MRRIREPAASERVGHESVSEIVAVPRRMRLTQSDRLTHRREQSDDDDERIRDRRSKGPELRRATAGIWKDHQQQDDREPGLGEPIGRGGDRRNEGVSDPLHSTRITMSTAGYQPAGARTTSPPPGWRHSFGSVSRHGNQPAEIRTITLNECLSFPHGAKASIPEFLA